MLEGKNVNLRLMEKEDIPLITEWNNNPEYFGKFEWLLQHSKADVEKRYDALTPDTKTFFIEKKDGTRIGIVQHFFDRKPHGNRLYSRSK